ncbi:MAG: chemotaxis protein CheR [Treponema sp.]|jgi:chemotaxis protein methyltransferase CheR|nr:chemotaxis protein CheR [Treponema sp.]
MDGETPVYMKEPRFDDPLMCQLYQQVEHTLGIRASTEALVHLRNHLKQIQNLAPENETSGGLSGDRERYRHIFSSPEVLFDLARLLTVNETYFFREQAHFAVLLRELLPRFAALGRPLRICSAATSIGCEAYSIAMVLDYYKQISGHPSLSWEIDAFDIDQEVIETASQGSYRANVFREDGIQWKFLLDRYVSSTEGKYRVDPRLRDHIHFYLHNIMDGLPVQAYDLIFFRNVSIYFSPESRVKVMNILANALVPEGYLIVGISETAGVEHPLLANCFKEEAFYFQKRAVVAVNLQKLQLPPRIPRMAPKNQEVRSLKQGLTIEPLHIAELIADDTGARLITEKTLAFLATVPGDSPSPAGTSKREKYGRALDEPDNIIDNWDNSKRGKRTPEDMVKGLVCMGNELITSLIVLINQGDCFKVDQVLAFIEQYDNSAYTHFLRGEYFYLSTKPLDAESSYKRAIQQDKAFWPAFYRLASLAAPGNPIRYVYKINQALESITQGKERGYEVFIGGFSPDYYQRALEKQRNKGLGRYHE